MAAGSAKPLPLPARPMFRPAEKSIHTLPPLDAVRQEFARAAAKAGGPQVPLMDEIAAKDAAAKTAEQQASADLVSKAIAEKLAPLFDAQIAAQADDAYNAAILQNPAAFATMYGREVKAAPSSGGVKLYDNRFPYPVVIVGRASNGANDVTDVRAASVECSAADAPVSFAGVNFRAVLRPGQALYVNVIATTYPANVNFSIIPLRGKASVFGG